MLADSDARVAHAATLLTQGVQSWLWPAVFRPRSAVDKQYGQMRILIRWCFSLKRHHVHEEPVRAAFLMSALRVEY